MFRKSVDRFRLSLSRGNVAPDGVMVGLFYGAVYRTVKTLQVRADQYVVYSEIEFVLVVRNAQPASRLGEGIIHVLTDDAVGIRDRGIVEVAAYYDVGMFGAGNGVSYAVGLRGTYGGGFGQFADKQTGTAFYFFFLRVFQHAFVYHFIFFGQFVRFQVIVDKSQGVFSNLYFVDDGTVVVAFVFQGMCRRMGNLE